MLLVKIYNFIKGYVLIFAEGIKLERFLNLISSKGIYVWDVSRLSRTTMRLKISALGFLKIRTFAKQTDTKIKIIKKYGTLSILAKYKKRQILTYGALFFVIGILFFSSLILDIKISGNNVIENTKIIEKLSKYHLKKMAFRSNIDLDSIRADLHKEFDNLAWINLEYDGTRLLVSVQEKKMPPKMIEKDVPCDIVAKKDAVIEKLTVENGETRAKIGDTVQKGQIIIGGMFPNKNQEIRYLHAMGKIEGKVWYEKKLTQKLYKYQKQYSGKKKVLRYLKVPGVTLPLQFNEQTQFVNSDCFTNVYTYYFLDFITKEISDFMPQKVKISKEQAIEEASLALNEQLTIETNNNYIISKNIEAKEKDAETIEVTLLAEAYEDIGEEVVIHK